MRPVAALPIVVTNSGGVHRGFSPGNLVSPESRCKCGFGAGTAKISWLLGNGPPNLAKGARLGWGPQRG